MQHINKSLQTLKTDLTHKEETLKTIQNHYPHLANLSEEQILKYFHVTTINALREHLQNTKINSACDHEMNNNTLCSCKDSKGGFKDLYNTQELAQEEAEQLMMHQMVKLRIYPCPYGYGWHLTKG